MGLKTSRKDHLVAFIGEFVGTFLFLFFGFAGAQTVNEPAEPPTIITPGPNASKLLYISLVFGFSLAVNAWIFFRVSGGLFNPAVTVALYLVGVVPLIRGIIVIIAQIAGGMSAAIIVKLILPGNDVLFEVSLAPGVTVVQGFFIEMFLTFELVFTILMLAAEKTKVTFVAPVGIGMALFIGHMVGVFWTGAAINPARAFGSSVAALTFPNYHWIYWFGPFLGAIIAAAFYRLLKTLRYEDVNGDQDKSADEESLIEAQTNRIENAFKRWHLQSRQSGFGMLGGFGRSQRPRSPSEQVGIYRMSGLGVYKQDIGNGYSDARDEEQQRRNSIRGAYPDQIRSARN